MTSEVRKCPKMGFCAVYRPPRTPYGMRKSGIFTVCVEILGWQHIKTETDNSWTNSNFAKNMFFWTFQHFLKNIPLQPISQPFMRSQRSVSYPQIWKSQLVIMVCRFFFLSIKSMSYETKSAKHILKKLTAMKFRNSKNLSYRSNQLERAYSEKIKTGSKFKNRIIVELFFIFLSLKKNFVVFGNFKNLIADSKWQYPTSYKWVSTDSS